MRALALVGRRFGRLIVTARDTKKKHHNSVWACICDCGRETSVIGVLLTNGRTRSCGCLHADVRKTATAKHGATFGRSPTGAYVSWAQMIQRCTNRNAVGYHRYGGRGITVCQRWRESFEDFLADMGERPAGLSLDRINNDGNYEPGNCRWADRITQSRNQRPRKRRTH